MSILSQKKKVFGDIAAFRTITEGMPKLKQTSSFSSINNDGNAILFLTDLLKALVGYDSVREILTNTLTYSVKDIEQEIKNALKLELKSIVSCGVDPSIPAFLRPSGTGIKYTVNKVDYTNLMMVDPFSDTGRLLYMDITPNLIQSSDYNAFLYQTIQNNGTVEPWPQTPTTTTRILTFQFKDTDISQVDPNNTITVHSHQDYNNKSLTDLNNDFINSITLFNAEKMITSMIDLSFGSVSSAVNKTVSQLQKEAEVNTVINKIINADAKDIIGDEYFKFSDKEKAKQQFEALSRKQGERVLNTSEVIFAKIGTGSLINMDTTIAAAATPALKKEAIETSLNNIGDHVASYSTNIVDKQSIKLDFIQDLINNLTRAIVNTILSPKIITIFLINFKIVYGATATFDDAVDFLKKNKNLIDGITKKIAGIIVKELLTAALKEITKLVAAGVAKQLIDKNKSNTAQLLSLLGFDQQVLRQLKGLT